MITVYSCDGFIDFGEAEKEGVYTVEIEFNGCYKELDEIDAVVGTPIRPSISEMNEDYITRVIITDPDNEVVIDEKVKVIP